MNLLLTNWQWQYSLTVYHAHSLDKCAQIITSNTVNLNTSNINMIPHKLTAITCNKFFYIVLNRIWSCMQQKSFAMSIELLIIVSYMSEIKFLLCSDLYKLSI